MPLHANLCSHTLDRNHLPYHLPTACSAYAVALREQCAAHSENSLCGAAGQAEALLLLPADASPTHEGVVRGLRMFVLKLVERAHGVGSVRRLIGDGSPLGWVLQWRESGDRSLLRFAGASSLPKHNPLNQLRGFSQAHSTVCGVLNTGDTEPLQALVAEADEQVGALAAALFHEVYLGGCVAASTSADVAAPVRQWLLESPIAQANVPAPERALLLALARPPPTADVGTWCACTPRSTPQQVLQTRVGCHVLSASLAADRTDPLAIFRSCFTGCAANSAATDGAAQTASAPPQAVRNLFLPCMPEDSAWYARRVMGGKWYRCAQGHAYYVDACGRPTEVLHCAECGAEIGGLDHNLLDSNQEEAEADQSPPLYCLKPAAEEHVEGQPQLLAVRQLSPLAASALRCLLHSALALACELGNVDEWLTAVKSNLLAPEVAPLPREALAQFFADHLHADWVALRFMLGQRSDDDAAAALHLLLLDMEGGSSALQAAMAEAPQLEQAAAQAVQERGIQHAPPALGAVAFDGVLRTAHARDIWERHVAVQHVAPLAAALDGRLHDLYAAGDGDEDGVFVSELLEAHAVRPVQPPPLPPLQPPSATISATATATDDPTEQTGGNASRPHTTVVPSLWSFQRQFSSARFLNELQALPVPPPLLTLVMKEGEQLLGLSSLPLVARWQALLVKRFARRITRVDARGLTVAVAISSAPPSEVHEWRAAFEGFARAWNASWRFVGQYGCLRIPDTFRNVSMCEDVAVSFCLPCEQDEGICSLALTQWLAEKHNQLVNLVATVEPSRSRPPPISSRQLTAAHAISFDADVDLWPYVKQQCTSSGVGGRERFDFDKAQSRVLEKALVGKPSVLQETRLMEFADDALLATGAMPTLRSKVPQEELPPDMAATLRKELMGSQSSSAVQRCSQTVDTCVAFLHETGGASRFDASARELPLLEYAQGVLQFGDGQLGVRPICFAGVRLKHLEALRRLLQECLSRDALALISHKYCEPLEVGDAAAVQACAFELQGEKLTLLVQVCRPSQLVRMHTPHTPAPGIASARLPIRCVYMQQVLRDFIIAQLKEEFLGADTQLAACLGCIEVGDSEELRELSWFRDAFPQELRLRESVACLRMLQAEEAQQAHAV